MAAIRLDAIVTDSLQEMLDRKQEWADRLAYPSHWNLP
jgi:hypothetical protein